MLLNISFSKIWKFFRRETAVPSPSPLVKPAPKPRKPRQPKSQAPAIPVQQTTPAEATEAAPAVESITIPANSSGWTNARDFVKAMKGKNGIMVLHQVPLSITQIRQWLTAVSVGKGGENVWVQVERRENGHMVNYRNQRQSLDKIQEHIVFTADLDGLKITARFLPHYPRKAVDLYPVHVQVGRPN